MHKDNETTLPQNPEIQLVDLDDLRAAFGGEGTVAADAEPSVAGAPSTVMCPSW